jgi:DNA-binding IclR family transcriptional regulator
MPRKSAIPSLAEQNAAVGGVGTLDRALTILMAFSSKTPTPSLAELSAFTQIPKSGVLRMLASFEHFHIVSRRTDGRYALSSEVARLNQIYQSTFSIEDVVVKVLHKLMLETEESASFYVSQGEKRLCLYRVDSLRPVRDHIRAGDLLPLNRGTGGRVLAAYSGAKGALYSKIRKEQVVVISGDVNPEVGGIGAPVFDANGELLGALTLTMPIERVKSTFVGPVKKAARDITRLIGGKYPDLPSAK